LSNICGLPVSNLYPENHVCNFQSIRNGEWHKEVLELFKAGKTPQQISEKIEKNLKSVQSVIYTQNHLSMGIGTGNSMCRKCGAIISSAHHEKKFHECGVPKEERYKPIINASIPCYFIKLDCCSGKCKKRVSISGRSIAQELHIKYSHNFRYSNSIIAQLNDPKRFIVCCSHHAEIIKTLREHHKRLKFNDIIELINNSHDQPIRIIKHKR